MIDIYIVYMNTSKGVVIIGKESGLSSHQAPIWTNIDLFIVAVHEYIKTFMFGI